MTKRPPATKTGDVLILQTKVTFTLYALGRVSTDGQTDFHHEANVIHVPDLDAAVVQARALLAPGGRIFVRDLDTDDWSELSDAT